MAKCLRCGAGPEWLQGSIPREAEGKADLVASRLAALEKVAEAAEQMELNAELSARLWKTTSDRLEVAEERLEVLEKVAEAARRMHDLFDLMGGLKSSSPMCLEWARDLYAALAALDQLDAKEKL